MCAVVGLIKLALDAGKATPAPPVGPALGAKGVNIMMFCKEYNARTADKAGFVIPVEITVFDVRRSIKVLFFESALPRSGSLHASVDLLSFKRGKPPDGDIHCKGSNSMS